MTDTPQDALDEIDEVLRLYMHLSLNANSASLSRYRRLAKAKINKLMISREEVEPIFKWLLGESGDFPVSEKGKRYNWRAELRSKLKRLGL